MARLVLAALGAGCSDTKPSGCLDRCDAGSAVDIGSAADAARAAPGGRDAGPPAPPPGCRGNGAPCASPAECCSGVCDHQVCSSSSCGGPRAACSVTSCCPGESCGHHGLLECCTTASQACAYDGDCCTDHCMGSRCACATGGGACATDGDCCAGKCGLNSQCCLLPGQPCGSGGAECCAPSTCYYPIGDQPFCCKPAGMACLYNFDCCGGRCTGGSCA